MEISVYDIHHIAAKYLNLRHHVYIVSDWLVFFCSFLCCQCGQYLAQDLPMDGLSETSSVMYQITPRKLEVNMVLSNEELFNRKLEEKPAVSTGNILNRQSCSLFDKPRELDRKVEPKINFDATLKMLSDLPNTRLSPVANRNQDFPTIHSHKRVQEQHQMSVA